jgi:8-oxo-dGTP diphosphatase
MRRFGNVPILGKKYARRPGVYAILTRGHQILLTYQEEPDFEFQLPGGGIDKGENPIQALHREVLEETGWLISNPRFLGVYKRFVYMPEYKMYAEKICKIFHAVPTLKISDLLEKGHTAHIMHSHLALRLIRGGDLHFLENHLKKI